MEEKYSENEIDYGQSDNKIVKWFRNYWYYYKWRVIGIAFALLVILFCSFQTCSNSSPDLTIMYAGTFPPADQGVLEMEKAFEVVLPADYDEDGEKEVDMAMMMIYSEAQIKALEAAADGEKVIDRSQNSGELAKFQNLIVSGEYYICLLEPWLFEMVNESGGFI